MKTGEATISIKSSSNFTSLVMTLLEGKYIDEMVKLEITKEGIDVKKED